MTSPEQKAREEAMAAFLAKKGITQCPKAPEPKKVQRLSVFEHNRLNDERAEKAVLSGRASE